MFEVDDDFSYALALSLREEQENHRANKKVKIVLPKPLGIVDPQWETIDPNPDIHGLFMSFNKQFFYGSLDGVEVIWSPRMYSCAGLCVYQGRGGLCSIRLSVPLLKLRPRKDLVETLLHEMIHAYLFVAEYNRDHESHGPQFHFHMKRINDQTGTNITVYHNFHDEVNVYRTHWWKCSGACSNRRPYYGLVKRTMNRAPGPNDTWWADHQAKCGGAFTKIREPEKKQGIKRKVDNADKPPLADLRNYFKPNLQATVSQNETSAKESAIPISTAAHNSSKNKQADFTNSGQSKRNVKKINSFANVSKSNNAVRQSSSSTTTQVITAKNKTVVEEPDMPKENRKPPPFGGEGHKLGTSLSAASITYLAKVRQEMTNQPFVAGGSSSLLNNREMIPFRGLSVNHTPGKNKWVQKKMDNFVSPPDPQHTPGPSKFSAGKKVSKVTCPICEDQLPQDVINEHLDKCLVSGMI